MTFLRPCIATTFPYSQDISLPAIACRAGTTSHILWYCPRSEKVLTHNQPFHKRTSTQELDTTAETTANQPSCFVKERISKGQNREFYSALKVKPQKQHDAVKREQVLESQAWAGILTLPLSINFIPQVSICLSRERHCSEPGLLSTACGREQQPQHHQGACERYRLSGPAQTCHGRSPGGGASHLCQQDLRWLTL